MPLSAHHVMAALRSVLGGMATSAALAVPAKTPDPVNTPGDKGYLGKTHDATGDIRLDHRSFNGTTGLFTSPDPVVIVANPGSFNPYAYGGMNPLAQTDPSGLVPIATTPGEPEPERQSYFPSGTTTPSGGGAPATSQSSCLPFASCEEKVAWNFQMGHDEWVATQAGSSFCTGGVCEHAGTYETWLRQFAHPDGNALERAAAYEWIWFMEGGGLRPSAVVDVILAAATLGAGSVPAGLRAGGLRLFGKSPAANGGANAVRVGQAGERAVQNAYQIGNKTPFNVLGRDRIADGMTRTTVSEVKNVGYQAYTQQLKDYVTFSIDTNRQFFLYVRGGANPTTLSTPFREAVGLGQVTLRPIP